MDFYKQLKERKSDGILQSRILKWVSIPFSGTLLTQGLNLGFPLLQEVSLLSELPGKPLILLYVSTNVTRLGISHKVNCIVFVFSDCLISLSIRFIHVMIVSEFPFKGEYFIVCVYDI